MRIAITLILMTYAQAAAAHPGHLIEQAGHNHWLAGAAIGLAILLGLKEAAKRRKGEDDQDPEEIEAEEEAA